MLLVIVHLYCEKPSCMHLTEQKVEVCAFQNSSCYFYQHHVIRKHQWPRSIGSHTCYNTASTMTVDLVFFDHEPFFILPLILLEVHLHTNKSLIPELGRLLYVFSRKVYFLSPVICIFSWVLHIYSQHFSLFSLLFTCTIIQGKKKLFASRDFPVGSLQSSQAVCCVLQTLIELLMTPWQWKDYVHCQSKVWTHPLI